MIAVQNGPFDVLLSTTEDAFVGAGNNLEDSVGRIQALRGAFETLEHALGADANARLHDQVEAVAGHGERLRQDFERIHGASGNLRLMMAGVMTEVRTLNVIVKLIANVSINARIQGNSLLRPRPQIASFVETLASLSAEAETVLTHANEAMSVAFTALGTIETAQADLSNDLRRTTLPAIDSFTRIARRISGDQGRLRDASHMIDEQMRLVAADVSGLITALQIGDTLRQRLEQVHAALQLTGPMPAHKALSFGLAARLADGALGDSRAPIDEALGALEALSSRGAGIIASAGFTSAATAQGQSAAGDQAFETFQRGLDVTRQHFAAMQAGSGRVRAQIQIILDQETALQRIAQHLRMAGINAVIACAKLGEDGRSLRELAQWLRSVTDDCDATMMRLTEALGAARDEVHRLGDDLIGRVDRDLGAFLAMAQDLGGEIGGLQRTLGDTSRQLESAASGLAQGLGTAGAALGGVRKRMTESAPAIALMHALSANLPAPDLTDATAIEYLAAIRARYTMASERQLHDALVAELGGLPDRSDTPPPAEVTPQDDLEDILF